MTNIQINRVKDQLYYSVYNSRGDLALLTSDREFAARIARAFRENPRCTEVVVEEPESRTRKRP